MHNQPPPAGLRRNLYTPFQVRLASFIGGPFAAVYTLHHNFRHIGCRREAKMTLYIGILFCVVLMALIPLLPDKFPNSFIPLAYSIAAGQIAVARQLSKEAILASELYTRCSAWNVAGVCVLSLIGFCLVFFPLMFALGYLGVVDLS